jgi:hypothetical protein
VEATQGLDQQQRNETEGDAGQHSARQQAHADRRHVRQHLVDVPHAEPAGDVISEQPGHE